MARQSRDPRGGPDEETGPMEETDTLLKDGTQVEIRRLQGKDIAKLMSFYRTLPAEERRYLNFDVTNRKACLERICKLETGEWARIVGLHKGQIIADGVLEFSADSWSRPSSLSTSKTAKAVFRTSSS